MILKKFRLCILIAVSSSAFGQSLNSDITQSNPGLTRFSIQDDLPGSALMNFHQIFIRMKNGLHMMPDGTGRLYKIDTSGVPNRQRLIRQDSTIFFGSTFGSYLFSYNDTIYSFGGYGYWKYNGQLRVFILQRGEWELENLNKEILFAKGPSKASLIWFNSNQGELWVGTSKENREGVKRSSEDSNRVDSVYVLNLGTKNWHTLGVLAELPSMLTNSHSTKSIASSPWGQLIFDGDRNVFFLIDYSDNKLFELKTEKATQAIKLISTNSILHFVDSNLVIQNGSNWLNGNFKRADTVKLSKSDFQDLNEPVYDITTRISKINLATNSIVNKSLIGGVFVGVVISSFVFFFWRNKSRKRDIYLNTDLSDQFDEKEREIIEFIKTNSKKGIGTKIEDINKILGVSQKNAEIQKKQRSDVFISINDKWKKVNRADGLLIEKKRLEHDKRSYEYFIEMKNFDKV